MNIKQTYIVNPFVVIAAGLIVSIVMAVLAFGGVANAYKCATSGNPTNDPTKGDVWEYHESDGKCWKVRYTKTGPALRNPTTQSLECANDEVFHANDNTCWKKDGYTIQETNNIPPVNNDGTPITAQNTACTDGFDYVTNGKDGPGCYKKAPDGSYPCGKNQDVDLSGSRAGAQASCGDVKNRVVPKNKQQSSDKTKATNNPAGGGSGGSGGAGGGGSNQDSNATGTTCGEADTVLVSCKGDGVQAIGDILRIGVTVLTVLIGVLAVGGLAYASILYAKAEDNQSSISEAKTLIRNIVIGILLYGFLIAIVNWLVPGGVIG